MESDVEASRQHGTQAFRVFSNSFLKTAKCNLDFCRGVGERRYEKSKPTRNATHKMIQERAGRAVSSEKHCAGQPFPFRTGQIEGGNIHNVNVVMRGRTLHKSVSNP